MTDSPSPQTPGADGPAPDVSVIVPVYNGEVELPACLEALLAQDYPGPIEVIVADNGSTDRTREMAAAYPVRRVTESEVVGSYAARNRGLAVARGAVVAFTDADCVPSPGWVSAAMRRFADPAVNVVGGEIVAEEPATEVERFLVCQGSLSQAASLRHPFRPYFATANVFFRRAVFDRVGPFNADLKSGGDVDLCWRAQAAGFGPLCLAEDATVRHRHRTGLGPMLRQQFKWGLGAGCLSRLYREEMGPVRRRIRWSGYRRVASAVARFGLALPAFLSSRPHARRRLRFVAWEVRTALRWNGGYWVGYHRPGWARSARL